MQQGKYNEVIAQRYAEALMDLAKGEPGLVDRLGGETAAVLEIYRQVPDIARLLATPLISAERKQQLLADTFGGRVHPYMLNFMRLLVQRRRIVYLPAICEQYQILLRALQQTVLVEVTTAVPLGDAQADALVERVKARTGAQRVELRRRVEPDILGGMILKIGDEVIDSSLRGQLRKLTFQLTAS
jgi:F-type H+-transporting ATPase subunit delta